MTGSSGRVGPLKPIPLGLKPGGSIDATQIFLSPGRSTRPDKICIILRGLPGMFVKEFVLPPPFGLISPRLGPLISSFH